MNRRQSIELMLALAGSAVFPGSLAFGADTTLDAAPPNGRGIQGDRITPAFQWLPMGAVKPTGWIQEQMLRDLNEGFAGCLGDLCHEASSDIFVSNRNTVKRKNASNADSVDWWNGESEGNWRAGFIMLSYLSGDQAYQKKADAYVQHILGSQDSDGYLGIFAPNLRFTRKGELWTQACLLRGLMDYAEMTGNRKTMDAVARSAALTIKVYGDGHTPFPWGENHDLMISDVMERLYDRTGDPKYRGFMLWFYDAYSKSVSHANTSLPSLLDRKSEFTQHGARVYESIRVPLWLWMATGRQDLRCATQNAFVKLNRYWEPSGSAVSQEAVENLSPDPTYTEYEYCSSKEIQFTLESALQKTGLASVGDKIERLWFNATQGARFPDGRAITYLTRDNRPLCDGKTPDGKKAEPRNKFSPTHADVAVCCNPNATNVAGLYVRGMWMRTRAQGLAALLYGPCTLSTAVKQTKVTIYEITNYPFEHTVSLEIKPEREVAFPLLLRDPEWSRGTRVTCRGGAIVREGCYWKLTKTWRAGDRVEIQFAPTVQEVAAVNGEIALQYGPLIFARPIESTQQIAKVYPFRRFQDTYCLPVPDKAEQLALPSETRWQEYGFRPIALSKEAVLRRPFDQPAIALEGAMTRIDTGSKTQVQLVPLGNAFRLRRVTFPVI